MTIKIHETFSIFINGKPSVGINLSIAPFEPIEIELQGETDKLKYCDFKYLEKIKEQVQNIDFSKIGYDEFVKNRELLKERTLKTIEKKIEAMRMQKQQQ